MLIHRFFLLCCFMSAFACCCYGQNNRAVSQNWEKAQQYFDNNNPDSALTYINEVVHQQPDFAPALLLRAKIYNNQQLFNKSLADYNALVYKKVINKSILFDRGVVFYQLKRYDDAIKDFEQSFTVQEDVTQTAYFKIDPTSKMATGISTLANMDSQIYNYLGLCYLYKDKYQAALDAFTSGLSATDASAELYINRANAYEKMHKIHEAMADYKSALALDPQNAIATYNLKNLNNPEKDIKSYLQAQKLFLEQNPDFAPGYAERGHFYYKHDDFANAISDYKKALALDSGNEDYLLNLALCQGKVGSFDEASALLNQLATKDPANPTAFFNLGNLYYMQDDFEGAISYYTMALQKDPGNKDILFNRALTYHQLHKNSEACSDMQQAGADYNEQAARFIKTYCAR